MLSLCCAACRMVFPVITGPLCVDSWDDLRLHACLGGGQRQVAGLPQPGSAPAHSHLHRRGCASLSVPACMNAHNTSSQCWPSRLQAASVHVNVSGWVDC